MARPISFDQEKTLEAIQDCFWDNGYSGTSLDDIMKATGLGKGSLYGSFGSKHDMYKLAFADYCKWAEQDYAQRLRGDDPGAIVRLREFVKFSAKRASRGTRRGCMLAKTTSEVAGSFPDIDGLINETFRALEREILTCVRQAQRVGDINNSRDAREVAMTLLVILRGMEALGRGGASPKSLALVVQGALDFLDPASS
jgi:TetR/AcrR family transcriptional regulator, transcriptional repressor for nem operon